MIKIKKLTGMFILAAVIVLLWYAFAEKEVALQSNVSTQTVSAVSIDADATEQIVVQALNFNAGDVGSFMDAEDDFTPDGWNKFMEYNESSLDTNGATTFNSRFEPTEDPVITSQNGGVVQLAIQGTLLHGSGFSSTSYQAVIYVELSGSPLKISALKQTTCGGSSTHPSPCEIN